MPILNTFCDALNQAIIEYETEVGGNVPIKRQPIVNGLRQLIQSRQTEQVDSCRFRQEMVAYVAAMPVKHFLFVSFESRLGKKLRSVLDKPDFSEVQLLIAEFTEMRACHKTEMDTVRGEVARLTKLLEDEQAKDNVKLVNKLSLELAREKKKSLFLNGENKELTEKNDSLIQENRTLLGEKIRLQKKCEELELKYEALLQEKQLPVKSNTPLETTFFN